MLLVSDGVTAAGGDWIMPMLQNFKGCDMKKLCDEIAATAEMRRVDGHEDDITVIALQLQRAV